MNPFISMTKYTHPSYIYANNTWTHYHYTRFTRFHIEFNGNCTNIISPIAFIMKVFYYKRSFNYNISSIEATTLRYIMQHNCMLKLTLLCISLAKVRWHKCYAPLRLTYDNKLTFIYASTEEGKGICVCVWNIILWCKCVQQEVSCVYMYNEL